MAQLWRPPTGRGKQEERARDQSLRKFFQQQTSIVLSTDRPDDPIEGQRIWETDTDREYAYDGARWIRTYRGESDLGSSAAQNLTTSFVSCKSVVVDAGSWVVIGKGRWNWNIGSLGEIAEGQLWNNTASAELDKQGHTYAVLAGVADMSLLYRLTVTVSTEIQMRIRTTATDGTQSLDYMQLVAIPG